MNPSNPIRFDRLQVAMGALIVAATGVTPTWAYGHRVYDRGPAQLVDMQLVSGPSSTLRSSPSAGHLLPVSSLVYTIVATANVRHVISLNGFDYVFDSTTADADVARDSLIADINADVASPYVATDTGAGELTVTPDFVGGVWRARVSGPVSVAAVELTDPVEISQTAKRLVVRVQSFSMNTSLQVGAFAMASQVVALVQTPDGAQGLHRFGVAYQSAGDPVDLSQIDMGRWQSRAAVDFEVTMVSTVISAPIERIETTDLTLNLRGPDVTRVLSLEI